MKLTYEQIGSIKYFILEKGDIERWTGWDETKPLVEAEFPELIHALTQLTIAERTLLAVTNSMDWDG